MLENQFDRDLFMRKRVQIVTSVSISMTLVTIIYRVFTIITKN